METYTKVIDLSGDSCGRHFCCLRNIKLQFNLLALREIYIGCQLPFTINVVVHALLVLSFTI